jgi:hypothetical protein
MSDWRLNINRKACEYFMKWCSKCVAICRWDSWRMHLSPHSVIRLSEIVVLVSKHFAVVWSSLNNGVVIVEIRILCVWQRHGHFHRTRLLAVWRWTEHYFASFFSSVFIDGWTKWKVEAHGESIFEEASCLSYPLRMFDLLLWHTQWMNHLENTIMGQTHCWYDTGTSSWSIDGQISLTYSERAK